ncbi:hypothetical protein [Neorhizobium galegae]|uniref:hypothetical protein n=1 Tax=Neorhizobium galegae TaxID=399 RepID=UPI000620F53F|nr:hypothetical protein [Neorhizobium galegae]CDZ27335.1 Hypothetical protein NGAL_HAMBI490_21790 [Neorhizobium galegae bv. officinalis]KAA9387310.1 hypothetical protein F4V88_12980 [Neorhizobium galegae]KAB1114456.1 hypothetical protein F4V89_08640 [Neorhizobium galegae]MCM2501109.1 hypothetical protein [Neorhizobium galegae]MCQ1765200.1 hypothetical protein [Neorhizobium galegae]
MTARLNTAANLTRVFCAMLLLLLGFAHQPVQASAPLDSYSEDYRLPDGTFADICSEGDHGHRMPAAKPLCEVCLLSASVILPPPDEEAWLGGEHASLANPLGQFPEVLGTTAVIQPKSRAPPISI